jgi:hypothetical protein
MIALKPLVISHLINFDGGAIVFVAEVFAVGKLVAPQLEGNAVAVVASKVSGLTLKIRPELSYPNLTEPDLT